MGGIWGGVGLREMIAALVKRILKSTCWAQVSIAPKDRTEQEGSERQDERCEACCLGWRRNRQIW